MKKKKKTIMFYKNRCSVAVRNDVFLTYSDNCRNPEGFRGDSENGRQHIARCLTDEIT